MLEEVLRNSNLNRSLE